MRAAADLTTLAALAQDDKITFVLAVYAGDYRFDWRGDNRVWVYNRFSAPDREKDEPIAVVRAEHGELLPGVVNTAKIEEVGMTAVKSTSADSTEEV